jgi:glycosyltransferase involved in cell wall biosynthesis
LDFPTVSIVIITYDRPIEIRKTIDALHKHIKYPKDKLLWHIADDNSPGDYLFDIRQDFRQIHFSYTVTDRKGWGANVNKALMFCWAKSPLVFQVEDDYVSMRDIDLERGVALLTSKKDRHRPNEAQIRKPIGLLRYDGIEAHWLRLQLREAETDIGPVHYMHILHNSPFLNIYSNRPHLKHRRFHDEYGAYDVGLGLAETESGFAHRVKASIGKPWITILDDGIKKTFDHIGHSRQGTELDNQK